MHPVARSSAIVALGLVAAPAPLRAADAPAWLTSAARGEPRSLDAKAPAEVLLDEGRWAVDDEGRIESRLLQAVRIRTRAGYRHAVARVHYATDSDKVRELRAWVIDPQGTVRTLGKSETLDLAAEREDVYNEQRVRVVDGSQAVEVGSVFGVEALVERRSFFNQVQWSFQSRLPTRLSRLELVLPRGWTSESHTFNHAPIEPVRGPAGLAWELRELPYLDDEPASPALSSLVPRLAVSYAPPPDAVTEHRSFASWEDVARWASEISDPRSEPDATVLAKARELTQGARDARQRLEAIARFVQGVPYISIQVGLGRFQPHPAPEVLAKQYGDCKDKVSLMRALLEAVGIRSHLLLVSADDRSFVRREWPSPTQFNHAIVAVAVEGAAGEPAAFSHPTLGRLLVFDPTDEHTRLGDIPEHEQGGLGLLAAAATGVLVPLPVIPAAAGQLVRETSAQLTESGALSAHVVERSVGQAAVRERRLWRGRTPADYLSVIEDWLAASIAGVRAEHVEAGDDEAGFRLELDLSADRYAQLMQGRLLVFKPALVSRHDSLALTAVKRQHPVVLHARISAATERIRLPPGFVVDETPAPVQIEAPFGSYSMTVAVRGDELVVARRLATEAATLPVADYAAARGFFQRIVEAEQAPVVLARK